MKWWVSPLATCVANPNTSKSAACEADVQHNAAALQQSTRQRTAPTTANAAYVALAKSAGPVPAQMWATRRSVAWESGGQGGRGWLAEGERT